MEDRNKVIIERIRRDLRRTSSIEVTDPIELYDECNRVQKFIIQEMKSIERELTIETKINVAEYEFVDESAVTVTDFHTSWGGPLKLVEDDWSKKEDTVGPDPYYINIKRGKIKLAPKPIRNNDVITFTVRQTDVVNLMDEDIEPEIPKEFDEVLIKGVCANYDPKNFQADYIALLDRAISNTISHNIPTRVEGTW